MKAARLLLLAAEAATAARAVTCPSAVRGPPNTLRLTPRPRLKGLGCLVLLHCWHIWLFWHIWARTHLQHSATGNLILLR